MMSERDYKEHHPETQEVVEWLMSEGFGVRLWQNTEIDVYLKGKQSLGACRVRPYNIVAVWPLDEDAVFGTKIKLCCNWEEIEDTEARE